MLHTKSSRPAHLPIPEHRTRVLQLISRGLSPNQIHFVLKISLRTIHFFYSAELKIAVAPKPPTARQSKGFPAPPLPISSLIVTGPNGERCLDD